MALDPSYTPDPEDETKPGDTGVAVGYAAKEIRFLKAYLKDKFTNIFQPHVDAVDNPHGVTKEQVGLPNIPNWDSSVDPALGNSDTTLVSQNAVAQAIELALQNKIFPVGAIYSSFADVDPATVLGFGTWTRLAAGKSIVSHDPLDPASLGTQIGANSINLTLAQMPAHKHDVYDAGHTHNVKFNDRSMDIGSQDTDVLDDSTGTRVDYTIPTESASANIQESTKGSGAAIDIRNEAYVVNMWQRVA